MNCLWSNEYWNIVDIIEYSFEENNVCALIDSLELQCIVFVIKYKDMNMNCRIYLGDIMPRPRGIRSKKRSLFHFLSLTQTHTHMFFFPLCPTFTGQMPMAVLLCPQLPSLTVLCKTLLICVCVLLAGFSPDMSSLNSQSSQCTQTKVRLLSALQMWNLLEYGHA